MSDSDTFYFLAFPKGDASKITVIDLAYSVSYERGDWANVNDETYYDHKTAIEEAKAMVRALGIEYVPFESRYNSSLNESLIEAIKPLLPQGTIQLHKIESAPFDETIFLYWMSTKHFQAGKIHIEDGVLFHSFKDEEAFSENPTHWAVIPKFLI